MKLCWPAPERNIAPISAVLADHLPDRGLVLEVASGTGQHVTALARQFPDLIWQPSDISPDNLASIAAWRAESAQDNLRPPLTLDVRKPWPIDRADVVFNANMIHITPPEVTDALLAGAAGVLPAGGRLLLYGPFLRSDVPTAASNLAFNRSLEARNPKWGIRALDAVIDAASQLGLRHQTTTEMPANNLFVSFERVAP